jgi:ribosomal protein S18 acetylase RimI-like enzyme
LMSIAVLPETQGKGIGQALVRAFLDEAARRGLCQVDLTTDRDHNEATNCFYQNLGFTCERTFTTPEGRAMNEYVINLDGHPI